MSTNKNIFLLAIVLAVVVNVFSWHLPFFWDTILTSTITQHFYENGFRNWITSAEFDAGHPPLFYMYVTCFYHVFGKNLLAAHLSVLPFTILGVVAFIQLLHYFSFSVKQQFFGVVLYFSIPAVITQNTMISYDAVLLSLYLSALVTFLKYKKIVFSIILIGIVGISLRGIFCLAALSVSIFFLTEQNRKKWFKWNLYFIPALIFTISWYYYHYTQTGWWLSTDAEGWNGQRGLTDLKGLFKNTLSVARCFFDLGIFVLAFLSLFYIIKKRKIDNYLVICLIPALIFSVAFLPFTNPINHRYYLIVYVLMLLPVIQFLSDRKIIYSFIITLVLLLGHFQIYPVPISNGWDCTLTHTIYTKIAATGFRESITKRLNLDISKIGTVFPMNVSRKQTEMLNDTIRMINVNGQPLDSYEFVLFSNIGNDFSDEQVNKLKTWIVQAYYTKWPFQLILYRNPHYVQNK